MLSVFAWTKSPEPDLHQPDGATPFRQCHGPAARIQLTWRSLISPAGSYTFVEISNLTKVKMLIKDREDIGHNQAKLVFLGLAAIAALWHLHENSLGSPW